MTRKLHISGPSGRIVTSEGATHGPHPINSCMLSAEVPCELPSSDDGNGNTQHQLTVVATDDRGQPAVLDGLLRRVPSNPCCGGRCRWVNTMCESFGWFNFDESSDCYSDFQTKKTSKPTSKQSRHNRLLKRPQKATRPQEEDNRQQPHKR